VTGALAELAALIHRTTGMTVPPGRETALRLAVGRAAPGLDPEDYLIATKDPVYGPGLVDRLIDEVTVHETSFARDMPQLCTIDWRALQRAARAAGSDTIRVWSAGCATGEEAYTLALLAISAFAPVAPPVDILGTDISGAVISAAEAGSYRPRAVRALDPQLRRRHLERLADGTYQVTEGLRALARFGRHNLIHDPYPPPGEARFDLILCRNVLIYFEPALARQVAELLTGSLRPGGSVMLGAADVLQVSPARTGEPRVPRAGALPGPGLQAGAGARTGASARTGAGTRAGARGQAPPVRDPAREPARAMLGQAMRERAGDPLSAGQRVLTRDQRLTATLTAAASGDRTGALEHAASLVEAHPLDADAHFLHGLVALEAGEPGKARDALRQALVADPAFCIAAFTLGRAYDALGDRTAARRAYLQALRTLDPSDRRHESLLQQVDLADIAAACQARLGGN
jgi:chemotaxis protein methyltransferase CheR